jgi:ubiquinone/menaquinone biosynthesis C-methylase UbiE
MGMAVSNPHFNKVSRDYDRGRVSEDIWFWAGEAERLAHIDSGSMVIDMGCGTGNYGLGIQARTRATVVGFDPAIGMLKQAMEKTPELKVVQSVAEHMPFRGDVFDLVYAAQVWHHVIDKQEAANECRRILKRGGAKIAHTIGHTQLNQKVVFKFFPEIKQSQLDVYPSDEAFKEYFRNAGFRLTEIYPYNMERYQSADEFIEIAEKKLWSMFRPITKEGLERGVADLRNWKMEHGDDPISNDEMITLFVGRK